MISELVTALAASAPRSLEPHFRPTWEQAPDDGSRLRVVVDQVASLTDISLVAWHKRHCR
jgi:dGTPase